MAIRCKSLPVKSIIFTLGVITSLLTTNAMAEVQSNVKPIPKAFYGKWAGMHSTDLTLNRKLLTDLCRNGGDQNTSYFITFNNDGQRIKTVLYWEDLYESYPVSFSKYSANHIKGKQLSLSYEMGEPEDEEEMLASKHVADFEYKIEGGKLYVANINKGYDVLMRCDSL